MHLPERADPPTAAPTALPARQSTLRTSNLALVTRTVLASSSPMSRARVAAATSMTRATAARLVDELVAGGVLAERGLQRSGRGRPGMSLSTGDRYVALGLQVSVGFLAGRVLDLAGREVVGRFVPGRFGNSRPGVVLRRLANLARALLGDLPAGRRCVGGGLALPGIVDGPTQTLLVAPNLGWSELPLAEFGPEAGLPFRMRVGNEADLAARAVAEPIPGRSSGPRDFVYLSGEIGVGGAIVRNRIVADDGDAWAGEIGHVCVDPAGPKCRCGSTGCLEQYVGRRALLRAAGLPDDAPTAALRERLAGGDHAAKQAFDLAADALGTALGSVLNVVGIPTVVLGGHLGELADVLAPRVERRLASRVVIARWAQPRVLGATGDPAAATTGAAIRALRAVIDDPAAVLGKP